MGMMPDDAYAMCPWCHETFPLKEVLDRLPPQLKILTADGEPVVVMEPVGSGAAVADLSAVGTNTAAGFHTLGTETAGSLDNLSDSDRSDSGGQSDRGSQWDHPTLNFGGDNVQPDGSWTAPSSPQAAAAMNVSPRPNRRKKKGSAIRSMIGVVFGGLLSVPIALLILLAVGRPLDLGFWPFDGKARSPRELISFFSEAVSDNVEEPTVYQGEILDTSQFDNAQKDLDDPSHSVLDQIMAPDSSAAPNGTSDDGANRKSRPEKERQNDLTRMPASPSSKLDSNSPNLPATTPSITSDETLKLPATTGTQQSAKQNGTPATTISASQSKPVSPLDRPIPVPTSGPNANISSEAITNVNAAIRSINQLVASENEDQIELLANAYELIAQACNTAQEEPKALIVLAEAVTKSNAVQQIEEAGLTWLDYPQRSTEGILLIGRPGTTAKSQILTLDSGRVLKMAGKINLPSVEKVIVLGQIMDEGETIQISHTQAVP